MPSWWRTALPPPSQPTRYRERIGPVDVCVVTPVASCAKDSNAQPYSHHAGTFSATDFSSGSSVYCEMSW